MTLDGNDPVSLFEAMSSVVSADSPPKALGTVPDNELFPISSAWSPVSVPIAAGMVPLKLFDSKLNSVNPVSLLRVDGIVPVKLFDPKFSAPSPDRTPIEVGRNPFRCSPFKFTCATNPSLHVTPAHVDVDPTHTGVTGSPCEQFQLPDVTEATLVLATRSHMACTCPDTAQPVKRTIRVRITMIRRQFFC